MARKSRSSIGVRHKVHAPEEVRPKKRDHNNPVSVEEFDRERMGIAAKE